MDVSTKIIVDLTENFANKGETLDFAGKYVLDGDLLPYPNAVLNSVEVSFGVTFVSPNVEVEGIVACHVSGQCDRCLTEVQRVIQLPFSQVFYKDSAEDVDSYVYSNSKLDATQAVRDEIVLSLPMSLLCNDDCKGLCPKCGTDLNNDSCNCDTTKENAFSILKNLKF